MWQLKNVSDPRRYLRHRQNKYRNIHTEIDTKYGKMKFHSKKEAEYYQKLLLINKEKNPPDLILRQVQFDLPGGIKHRVDFLVIKHGQYELLDSKGYEKDQVTNNKRKQVEELYEVTIRLV